MQLFAASCDSVETNTRFAESLSLTYPILSDPGGDVARAYGVLRFGVKAPKRWTFYIGADGTILHVDRSVNAASAGEDVAARLDSLDIPKRE